MRLYTTICSVAAFRHRQNALHWKEVLTLIYTPKRIKCTSNGNQSQLYLAQQFLIFGAVLMNRHQPSFIAMVLLLKNQLTHNLPIIGKLWFEKGLSFMIANIRGGAEFGPQWHQAALRGKNIKSWKESRGSGATIMATRVKQFSEHCLTGNQSWQIHGVQCHATPSFKSSTCESPLIDMICTSKAEMLLYGKINMMIATVHSFKKVYVV